MNEAAQISDRPYWWEEAPLSEPVQTRVDPSCDVAIVGAGYTGLSAAITLARAGRSVQVFDRMRPGEGASTRNGGITSGNLRLSHREMAKRFGEERAWAIEAEAKVAREDLYRFIAEERIDCDLAVTGRFSGAAVPAHYDKLARAADGLRKLGIEAHAVSRECQREFIGTDFYHGGMVRMDIGGLHPAKFHAGMLRVALEAGVLVHSETAVLGIASGNEGHRVTTARGTVLAREVITGTNGYADESDRWLRRRIVPIRSRIVATEPLSPNLMGALMPRRMMLSETRELSFYYRPSPDGRRILFGGRDGSVAGEPAWPTNYLRDKLVEIFPELSDTNLTNSWYGRVAMHRDMTPRVFTRRGIHYATGYCGSGVVWARWAGQKAAMQVLGLAEGATALDFRPPASVPLFNGTPWFLPAYFVWLRMRDALAARSARR